LTGIEINGINKKGDVSQMKAMDFDLSKQIKFDFETGITTFKDNRIVIFNADAVGLLRQNLIEEFGLEKARKIFLQFGFQNGYADFLQIKLDHAFDNETELMASGPIIHTWEGIVKSVLTNLEFDREKKEFFCAGYWHNTYEAEQHLSYNAEANDPVCWSVMGYASGWCTAFFGLPILAIETSCVGKGDADCYNEIKPVEAWEEEEAKPYLDAYSKFFERMGHNG
jgi:hypothetical protein